MYVPFMIVHATYVQSVSKHVLHCVGENIHVSLSFRTCLYCTVQSQLSELIKVYVKIHIIKHKPMSVTYTMSGGTKQSYF